MAGRKGQPHPMPVRFSMVDSGVYVIWDIGGQADSRRVQDYHETGHIRATVAGWQVFDKAGQTKGPPQRHLQQAKNWYLTSRGLPIHSPSKLETEEVAIQADVWGRADDWRAKVFRILTRNPRNTVAAVDALLSPMRVAQRYYIFAWPKELADDWFRYVREYH